MTSLNRLTLMFATSVVLVAIGPAALSDEPAANTDRPQLGVQPTGPDAFDEAARQVLSEPAQQPTARQSPGDIDFFTKTQSAAAPVHQLPTKQEILGPAETTQQATSTEQLPTFDQLKAASSSPRSMESQPSRKVMDEDFAVAQKYIIEHPAAGPPTTLVVSPPPTERPVQLPAKLVESAQQPPGMQPFTPAPMDAAIRPREGENSQLGLLIFILVGVYVIAWSNETDGKNLHRWSWSRIVAIIVLLYAAMMRLPYDQYLLLKFVVCAIAVHTAYKAKVQRESGWVWIMAILAVLFNPFVPIHLATDTWKTADWICAVIIGMSLKRHIGRVDDKIASVDSSNDQQESQNRADIPNGRDGKIDFDPDASPYTNTLEALIKDRWNPCESRSSNVATVAYKIHRNGRLSNLRIQKSSGDSDADTAALAAVRNVAPFPILPSNSPDNVDVQSLFLFDALGSDKNRVLSRTT